MGKVLLRRVMQGWEKPEQPNLRNIWEVKVKKNLSNVRNWVMLGIDKIKLDNVKQNWEIEKKLWEKLWAGLGSLGNSGGIVGDMGLGLYYGKETRSLSMSNHYILYIAFYYIPHNL
jgi:hypothetical protein